MSANLARAEWCLADEAAPLTSSIPAFLDARKRVVRSTQHYIVGKARILGALLESALPDALTGLEGLVLACRVSWDGGGADRGGHGGEGHKEGGESHFSGDGKRQGG